MFDVDVSFDVVDIHKLLIETSTELQKVFNSCCGFWSTHTALIDIVGEIIARIGYLQTEATLLCRLGNAMQKMSTHKIHTSYNII